MPRLEVELLVCPDASCQQVGKRPYDGGLKGYCVGSAEKGTAHKKRRMVPVVFEGKAPEKVGAGAES